MTAAGSFRGIGMLFLTVWCMVVFPALHAGGAEKARADDLSPCPPPEELIRRLDVEVDDTGSWFVRERGDLLHFAL